MAYRQTKQPPITPETTLENARKWLNIVRYGESGSVIQLQDDCEYRLSEILENPKILKKYLGPYYRKYLLIHLPYNQSFDHTIRESLDGLCRARNIRLPENNDVNSYIKYVADKGYEIALFISRLSPTLEDPVFRELLFLEKILQDARNFSVVCFFESDITHPDYRQLTDKCSLIFDNIIKYPLYNRSDSRQFIKYQRELWNLTISKKLENEILDLSGGYLWIISAILRYFRDNPKQKIESAVKDEQVMNKAIVVWDKLTETQKTILKKAANKQLFKDAENRPEYDYLKKIRLISGKNDLGLPIFNHIIDRENKAKKLTSRDNAVFLENRDISNELTYNEKVFLSILIKNSKKIVTRNDLAKAIWKDSWEEKYSDWAIDRLAYRLRQKLTVLGIDNSLLKTAKRKGFIFG